MIQLSNMEEAFQRVVSYYGFVLAQIGNYGDYATLRLQLGFPFTVELKTDWEQPFHDRNKSFLRGFILQFKVDLDLMDYKIHYRNAHYYSLRYINEMKKKYQLKILNGDKL
jgi:hypothetical protein